MKVKTFFKVNFVFEVFPNLTMWLYIYWPPLVNQWNDSWNGIKKICLLTMGNMLDLYIYIVQLLDIKNFPCLTVYGPIIHREMPETLILWRKRETEILAQGNFMFSVNLEVRYQSKRWQFYQDDKWQQRGEKKICCTL